MTTIPNHSVVLLFLATLLFMFLLAGVVVLWYAARMNLNDGLCFIRTSLHILNNQDGGVTNRCRREFKRVDIDGLRADISDGLASYSGLVTNISAHGLCLQDVPDKLSSSRSLLSVVVRGQVKNYRIVARPRWVVIQENKGKSLGVEIASSPTSWNEFVFSH